MDIETVSPHKIECWYIVFLNGHLPLPHKATEIGEEAHETVDWKVLLHHLQDFLEVTQDLRIHDLRQPQQSCTHDFHNPVISCAVLVHHLLDAEPLHAEMQQDWA